MKTKFFYLIALIVLLAAAYGLGRHSGSPATVQDSVQAPAETGQETAGTATKGDGERKIKYWVAPMDPTFIRDEPGKSPMGMDLVPVYEDEVKTGSTISVDPVTAQNMGVRTAYASRRDLTREIRTSGLVAYEEPRQYAVNTKFDGWIEKLFVNETGAPVKQGAPLLEIYSPALVSLQEEYLLAYNNARQLEKSDYPEVRDGAVRLLDATRQKLKLWDISARQIAQLEKTGQVRRTLTLYAQFGGIVTTKAVDQGAFVKAGSPLLQIADLSRIWVFADIYENELPLVTKGQHADIILPFVGDKQISGTVSTIYPYVDPRTRTVKARIDLDNSSLELRPDMFVNVRLHSEPRQNVLAVPAEAVINSGEKQTLFISLGEGRFEPRRVETGLLGDDGWLEIKEGLSGGELVVTSAQFLLDSESQLQEAIQKMLAPESPEPEPVSDAELDDLF